MSGDEVRLEKADGLAVIVLDRPGKLNALNATMRARFGAHLDEVENDPSVRVVLLRGEGRAFCAGADLVDAPADPIAWRARIRLAQSQHLAIATMSKPVIAAVQGAVVGGGASIALAADILVMADDARLVFPFVHLGLVPDGGASYLLQAKLSTSLALDLLMTGGSFSAADAARAGLTRRVVPARDLESTARALAAELLALPPEAAMLTKSLCGQNWAASLHASLAHEADAFALATATPGHRNALAKMKQRLTRQEQH